MKSQHHRMNYFLYVISPFSNGMVNHD